MENVKKKHARLGQALETFRLAIRDFNNIDTFGVEEEEYQDRLHIALRNSVVKSFEYCIDLSWKYVKVFLEKVEKSIIEQNTPRYIFRKAFEANIFEKTEIELSLEMLDSRNQTSHIYKEEVAEFIVQKTPAYYNLMMSISRKMNPSSVKA
jgi:nucleotidyltransferase substrate binding protein (TIGR01987 family)